MDPTLPIYQGGQSAAGSAMQKLLALFSGLGPLGLGGVAPGQTMTYGTPFTGVPPTQLGGMPTGVPPTQLGTSPALPPAPPPVDPSTTMSGPTGTPNFNLPGAWDVMKLAARGAANVVNPIGGIAHGLQSADSWWNKDAAAAPTDPVAAADLASTFPTAPYTAPDATPDPNADVALSVPFDINSMPMPPVLGPPPTVDMERVQRAARDSVLGGLARGAASVDATDAGSFAKALAAAGGGGATAAGEAENKQSEIEYQNALNEYNVSMKNKQSEYEHAGQKWELTKPTIKATDDSIIVQEYDPKDKAYKTRVIKTDGILGDSKKLKDTIEAMGGSGPAAESMEVRYIAKTLGSDPAALKGTLRRVAIERTLDNGAGEAVFGENYKAANEKAIQEISSTSGMSTDPEKSRKAINKRTSAILLSQLKDDAWIDAASQYGSVAATILKDGQQ